MFQSLWDIMFVFIFFGVIFLILYIIGLFRAPYVPPIRNNYTDIKPLMETGDVLLFKSDGVMARISSVFSPSVYFHVAFIVVGPDGRIMLIETDNSKTIRRDGCFLVDLETKMAKYPNSELALWKLKRPIGDTNPNLQWDKCRDIFWKYTNKYTFQKNVLGWLRMAFPCKETAQRDKQSLFYKFVGECPQQLCIEQVTLALREVGVIDPETNTHSITPEKYFKGELPFINGYGFEGIIRFDYKNRIKHTS
jgi:hypothetical protein